MLLQHLMHNSSCNINIRCALHMNTTKSLIFMQLSCIQIHHYPLHSASCPSYQQVMQSLSLSLFPPLFLLLSIFKKMRKNILFSPHFFEGAPSFLVVTCRTPTFSGATYIFFSLIQCCSYITLKMKKCRCLKSSLKTILIYLILPMTL